MTAEKEFDDINSFGIRLFVGVAVHEVGPRCRLIFSTTFHCNCFSFEISLRLSHRGHEFKRIPGERPSPARVGGIVESHWLPVSHQVPKSEAVVS